MKTIILIIVAFLLFTAAAFGQGSIEGTIKDAQGKGAASVTVTAYRDGKAAATATTDEDGAYTFEDLAAGKYKIVTNVKGYETASQTNVAVSDEESATVDLTLKAEAAEGIRGPEQTAGFLQTVKFHFEIEFAVNGQTFKFSAQEVSGLSGEAQAIEYKPGDPKYTVIKIPGIKKYDDVTIKKGIFKDDKGFWDIYKKVTDKNTPRGKFTISLLDDNGSPTMVWTLNNAFINTITGNGHSFETLVIVHEGLSVVNQ